jgi:membrane protein DedA with SNARE-associated domain
MFARHSGRVFALAAVTDSLVNVATQLVGDLGLAGIFVLMLLESACIPIPSEVTMLFAGFGVSQGRFSLVAVVVAGVLGNLVGSWLAFGIGRFGRRELIERRGRRLRRHLEWADRWFERYGSAAVFFSRLLPVIRTFISLPAGAARVPLGRFSVLTVAGCVPWVLLLAVIGEQVGRNWKSWHASLQYVDYGVVALAVVAIVFLAVRRPWSRSTAS